MAGRRNKTTTKQGRRSARAPGGAWETTGLSASTETLHIPPPEFTGDDPKDYSERKDVLVGDGTKAVLTGDGTKAPPPSQAAYSPRAEFASIQHGETAQFPGPLAPPPALPDIWPPEKPGYGGTMLEDDRIITKEGVRFLPLSLAAPLAQAPRTTLLDWIKAKAKFQGRALDSYHSPTLRRFYLSEESVNRVANRFIKWPSKSPAGAVKLGETKDHGGYIGIAKAARTVGVDHHTMWLWTAHGTAPVDKPLDVIKCTASDQFYISEKDALSLKKLVPRSGLRRGRRPQLGLT